MKQVWISLSVLSLLSSCAFTTKAPPSYEPAPIGQVRDVPSVIRGTEIEGPRQRLVVLPILDQAKGHPDSLKRILQNFILDELALTNQVVLIKPTDLGIDFAEYTSQAARYDMDKLTVKAKEAGVNSLLEVAIDDIRVRRRADNVGIVRSVDSEIEATLNFRLVSTKTGKVLWQDTKVSNTTDSQMRFIKARSTDRLVQHDPYIVEELLKNMTFEALPAILSSVQTQSWEGRIAMVKGDRIYLNVGRLSGLQMGDILKVSETGDQIYDPETGALVGEISGRMKGTLEVVGYFGKDGAVAVVHSGSDFKENDRIELY